MIKLAAPQKSQRGPQKTQMFFPASFTPFDPLCVFCVPLCDFCGFPPLNNFLSLLRKEELQSRFDALAPIVFVMQPAFDLHESQIGVEPPALGDQFIAKRASLARREFALF